MKPIENEVEEPLHIDPGMFGGGVGEDIGARDREMLCDPAAGGKVPPEVELADPPQGQNAAEENHEPRKKPLDLAGLPISSGRGGMHGSRRGPISMNSGSLL